MPEELRKFYNPVVFPEEQSAIRGFVHDEVTAREHEDADEVRNKYFRSKFDFWYAETMKQMQLTNRELESAYEYHRDLDPQIERRADFMFSYTDYDNDRERAFQRFRKEMDKQITLKDIGDKLDQFLLDEKAAGIQYLDPTKDQGGKNVKSASKDVTSFDMTWTGRLFKNVDPLKPLLMDDPSELDSMPEGVDTPYRDILDRIKYEDERTDYSQKALTADQRTEMALFHSFK